MLSFKKVYIDSHLSMTLTRLRAIGSRQGKNSPTFPFIFCLSSYQTKKEAKRKERFNETERRIVIKGENPNT